MAKRHMTRREAVQESRKRGLTGAAQNRFVQKFTAPPDPQKAVARKGAPRPPTISPEENLQNILDQGGTPTQEEFIAARPVSEFGAGGRADRETKAYQDFIASQQPDPIQQGIDQAKGEPFLGKVTPAERKRAQELGISVAEMRAQEQASKEATDFAQIQADVDALRNRTATEVREDTNVTAEELGLATSPADQAAIAQELLDEQAKQTEFAEAAEARARELEDLGLRRAAESVRRNTAAATQAFSGRGGAISTARQALPSEFSEGGERVLNEAKLKIEEARARRAELERRRRKALKNDQRSLAASLQREIDSQKLKEKQAVLDAEAALETAEAATAEREQERAQAQLDFFSDNPTALVGASADSLSSLLQTSLGLPAAVSNVAAQGLINEASIAMQAKGDDAVIKAAQVQKALADMQNAGRTSQEQEIAGLQRLRNAGIIQSDEDFQRAVQEVVGIADSQQKQETIKVGDDVYVYDPVNKTTTKIVDSSGSSDITPTGTMATATFAGRDVTLDSGALAAFSQANSAATAAGLDDIKIGAVATSTFRDNDAQNALYGKGRTQEALLAAGFSSEEAARYADPTANVVTWTTESKHESGLAVDIFPDRDYINQVKPYLEAEGWVQTMPVQDPGHFEFKGKVDTKGFDSSLLPLYTKFEDGKMTKEDWNTVETMGISRKQFVDQSSASKVERDKMGAEFATEVIALAESLKNFEKDPERNAWFIPDILAPKARTLSALGLDFVPGTDPADFDVLFKAFQAKLGLNELTSQKAAGATFGALSNQELQFLTSAATSLDPKMGEAEYQKELDRIIEKLKKAGGELPGAEAENIDTEADQVVIDNTPAGHYPVRTRDGQTGYIPINEYNPNEYTIITVQ